MATNEMTKVGSDELLDELQRRVARLERAAKQVGSVGAARLLVGEAFEAGRCAGHVEQLTALAGRMQDILVEATAQFDADATTDPNRGADTPALQAWRAGRQHLWHLVDGAGKELLHAAQTENGAAGKRRRWLEQRVLEVLAPAVPLRLRLGQWLLAGSARLAQRGAA